MTRNEALAVMGLSEGFTDKDLRRAYKKLALERHPDVRGSHEAFIELKKAYDLLSLLGATGAEILLTHASIFSVVRK